MGFFFLISISDSSLSVYRKATDFCVLILYHANLLNSFISLIVFFMVIYGFLYRVSSHLGRVRALLLPLLLGCHLYLYSCLIVVARISDTILSRNRESRHHCIVPDFREKFFKFKPLNMQLAVGLLWIFGCCELRYVPSKTNFDGVFNMNRWSFIPVLFLYLLILWFLSFLKNVVYHNDRFLNIEASLHSWNKTNLTMMHDSL